MINLPKTLAAWGSSAFEQAFKAETAALDAGVLPLQEGLSHSTNALADSFEFMLLSAREENEALVVTAGIFYQGIVAGCSCADDPTPVEPQTECCEVELTIRWPDARTEIRLL